MRKKTPVGLLALFAAALAVVGGACKQSVGDRCEQNTDCASGVCSLNGAGATGGRCCASLNDCPNTGMPSPDSGFPLPIDSGVGRADGSRDVAPAADGPGADTAEDASQTLLDGASAD
jgi:hypothetical protein